MPPLVCRGLDMSEEGTNVNLKDVHKFVDEYEVELVARCCRYVHVDGKQQRLIMTFEAKRSACLGVALQRYMP
jgi:hypothetical protein